MGDLNFGSLNEYEEQINTIKGLALKLRKLRPQIETNWETPADWTIKYSNLHGKPAQTLTITLTPTGCAWANLGGCTMCGEFEGSTKNIKVSPVFHIAQFSSAVSKYVAKYSPDWIRIYQEGNYPNPHEIDSSAQFIIIRLASLISGIKRITVESMAKYVTSKNIALLKSAVANNVELEFGMGFEGENDIVRNVCVNKGEKLEDFRKAIKILKDNGVFSVAYVLLKPPFLSEIESINEAITTIQVANEMGFDAISLQPVTIHPFSLVHALHVENLYQLPWLWSVIKVAQSAKNISDFRISGVGFYPRPLNIAFNRHTHKSNDCNEHFWHAIKEYGKNRNFQVFESLTCSCKGDWEIACQETNIPLKSRIDQQLNNVNMDHYTMLIEKGIYPNSRIKHAEAIDGGTQYSLNK